jgi:hypothetical protein
VSRASTESRRGRRAPARIPRVVECGACWLPAAGEDSSSDAASRAARRIFRLYRGELPPGSVVVRTCGSAGCLNPDHLELQTRAELVELSAAAKLTAADVREIRRARAAGVPRCEVAERFGVDPTCISHIVARRRWRTVA